MISKSTTYDERFVAFIDILGFKSLIEETITNDAKYQYIQGVLNHISSVQYENYHGIFSEYGVFKEVSVFSDSIVISYPKELSIGCGLFHLLIDVTHLCLDLLEANILVRGGITYGKMYHSEKVCFGPAMIRAYEMEENLAVYPRIIVEQNAILTAFLHMPEEDHYYINNLLSNNGDYYYLDFLSQCSEFDDEESYIIYMKKVKYFIETQLKMNHDPKISQKYIWFSNYYNITVTNNFKNYLPHDMIINL